MKIGVMNRPSENIYKEIEWIGRNGFDFMDLTFEIKAAPDKIDVKKVKKLLNKYNLEIVGHTAPQVPYADSFKELRDASWSILNKELAILQKLEVKKLNIHYNKSQRHLGHKKIMDLNTKFLRKLTEIAKIQSIDIMIENMILSPDDFIKLFKAVPKLKFHLDIGHANLISEDAAGYYLKNLSKKLVHVHLSDNNGFDDLHLPLGAGNINWKKMITLLKKYKYNGTFTLEVFSNDRDYLLMSRDKFKKWWKEWR